MDKVFYVNPKTHEIAVDANDICNHTSCGDCPWRGVNCASTIANAPDKFAEDCGYVSIPLSVIDDYLNQVGINSSGVESKTHYITFPRTVNFTFYTLTESQMVVLDKLAEIGACEYEEVTIQEL